MQHDDAIHDAQVDFFGKRLATCSSDHSIKIYKLENGEKGEPIELFGHDAPVWQVAWAHPKFGTVLASCGYDRKVCFWRECGGLWELEGSHVEAAGSVNSISFAPPDVGLYLACGVSDGSITVIEYQEKEQVWKVESHIEAAHEIGCNSVCWCPDGRSHMFVSGGCDNLVKIWNRDKSGRWKADCLDRKHSDWVRDVAWAQDLGSQGHVIASCSQDRTVIIWSTKDNNKSNVSELHWETKVLTGFKAPVWRLSWSYTGNLLAVTCGDGKVSIWKQSLDGDEWKCIESIDEGTQQ